MGRNYNEEVPIVLQHLHNQIHISSCHTLRLIPSLGFIFHRRIYTAFAISPKSVLFYHLLFLMMPPMSTQLPHPKHGTFFDFVCPLISSIQLVTRSCQVWLHKCLPPVLSFLFPWSLLVSGLNYLSFGQSSPKWSPTSGLFLTQSCCCHIHHPEAQL